MRYVRIKTEKEFLEEFGEYWRNHVAWTTGCAKDHLFGRSIPYFSEERRLYNGWSIYKDMVTYKWAKGTYVECLAGLSLMLNKGDVFKIVETELLNNSLCLKLENGCVISGELINHLQWLGEKTEPRKHPLSIQNPPPGCVSVMGQSLLKDAADAMMKEPIKTTIDKGIWEYCREFDYLRGLRDTATTPKFLKQIHKIEIKKRKSERKLNLKFR